jgi:acetyl esterase/lipase
MNPDDAAPPLNVPAREIPMPQHLSVEAKAVLGFGALPASEYPALDDAPAWRQLSADRDAMVESILGGTLSDAKVEIRQETVGDCSAFVITPHERDFDGCAYLDIHGGAMIMGGGDVCRLTGIMQATSFGVTTWSPDYRMPPDHPYPAALDDCLAAYRRLLIDYAPDRIVIGGGSAGGNLAAATILRARDEGLPLPAAALLMTPELDLTNSGDTFSTNFGVDTVLTDLMEPAIELYSAGHDLLDPYLSPLFGDFSRGFPPTLLTSGTRDLFLSNTVRMHRALRSAGIAADLHIIEAGPHGGFFHQAPEDKELDQEIRAFLAHWWA